MPANRDIRRTSCFVHVAIPEFKFVTISEESSQVARRILKYLQLYLNI